jgi:hypothetical protein
MAFNATTPQSEVVKKFFEACLTLDMNNTEPFISKDFRYQTFPKIVGLPDESKEGYLERYGVLLSLMTKIEVCIQTPPSSS